MNGLESVKKDSELNSERNREPVEFFQVEGDMVKRWNLCCDAES